MMQIKNIQKKKEFSYSKIESEELSNLTNLIYKTPFVPSIMVFHQDKPYYLL